MPEEFVNVRSMVDDVESAAAFYTAHFGYRLRPRSGPATAKGA
jgi:catechol 2,3-dioxygenase-like lactoylglutathione lyase family enzyme